MSAQRDASRSLPAHQPIVARYFDMKGINCSSCVRLILSHLNHVIGVREVSVNIVFGRVLVTYDPRILSDADLVTEFQEIGFQNLSVSSDETPSFLRRVASLSLSPAAYGPHSALLRNRLSSYPAPICSENPLLSWDIADDNENVEGCFAPYFGRHSATSPPTQLHRDPARSLSSDADNGSEKVEKVAVFGQRRSTAPSNAASQPFSFRISAEAAEDEASNGSYLDIMLWRHPGMAASMVPKVKEDALRVLHSFPSVTRVVVCQDTYFRVEYNPRRLGAREILSALRKANLSIKHCASMHTKPPFTDDLSSMLRTIYPVEKRPDRVLEHLHTHKHTVAWDLGVASSGLLLLMILLFIPSPSDSCLRNLLVSIVLRGCVAATTLVAAGGHYKKSFQNYCSRWRATSGKGTPAFNLDCCLWPCLCSKGCFCWCRPRMDTSFFSLRNPLCVSFTTAPLLVLHRG